MKIRSITYFVNPGWPVKENVIDKAGSFLLDAKDAFNHAGYEVQTSRLATIPFPDLVNDFQLGEVVSLAQSVEDLATSSGFEYISIGPANPRYLDTYKVIPEVLSKTESVFLSGVIASPRLGISLPAIRACAEVIFKSGKISPDGFANLRFAALANVPSLSPFFPAAYLGMEDSEDNEKPLFALATEAADLAVEAFSSASSLSMAREGLKFSVEKHADKLTRIGDEVALRTGIRFAGLDFSLAPFPDQTCSIGAAIERLGISAIGLNGSLAGAAFITDALDRANYRRVGFNGLIMPLLEDVVLATRAAEETLTVNDLLLYSSVCGTGLDTIPLPGDMTKEQLAAILLDVAALSQRLDKPLTARFMPIPGKRAGDPTNYKFEYFANSRVMGVRAGGLTRHFSGDEEFGLLRERRQEKV